MITTNNTGLTKAGLCTSNGVHLFAKRHVYDYSFKVTTDNPNKDCDCGWWFNEKSCREAAEFFTKLADELERLNRNPIMSNDLTTFTFNASSIRVVMIDGNPWFVAKDLCAVLGLKGYPSFHTSKLDRSEVQNVPVSKAQNLRLAELFGPKVPVVALVSESGLYKLVLRSDKPQAKPFQDWVTEVILPAIRKDGAYVMGEGKVVTGEMSEDELVLKALGILGRTSLP